MPDFYHVGPNEIRFPTLNTTKAMLHAITVCPASASIAYRRQPVTFFMATSVAMHGM